MQLVSQEHDDKYLKGGLAGFFIGVATTGVIVILLLNKHPGAAIFAVAIVVVCLVATGAIIDAHARVTIEEVDRWRH